MKFDTDRPYQRDQTIEPLKRLLLNGSFSLEPLPVGLADYVKDACLIFWLADRSGKINGVW